MADQPALQQRPLSADGQGSHVGHAGHEGHETHEAHEDHKVHQDHEDHKVHQGHEAHEGNEGHQVHQVHQGHNNGHDNNQETVETAAASGVAPPVTAPLTHPVATSTPPAKERHSLTLDQRRALRRWANSQPNRPSHKLCIEWFYSQYGQHISQSTVSHSLSPKYSRLDGDNPQLSGSRLRFGNWPDVEKLVLLWYQQVQASGRQPTNDELAEKAKSIFSQLPRYKEEQPPEFSPGWIHRFKKRYGLLVRRQRRHGDTTIDPADNIDYLADCIPRFMTVSADTSPAAVKESVLRVLGVEATLQVCALVRDEILRRAQPQNNLALSGTNSPQVPAPNMASHPQHPQHSQTTHPTDPNLVAAVPPPSGDTPMYGTGEDDPEVVLQNALRQLQQEEADAEASAAAAREEREQRERAQGTAAAALATPAMHHRPSTTQTRFTPVPGATAAMHGAHGDDLSLTPIKSDDPISHHERPVRCPFCVNQRMLRTIKEAVEHMSTHVVV